MCLSEEEGGRVGLEIILSHTFVSAEKVLLKLYSVFNVPLYSVNISMVL